MTANIWYNECEDYRFTLKEALWSCSLFVIRFTVWFDLPRYLTLLLFCLPRGQPSTRSLRGRGDSDPSVAMLPHSRPRVAPLNGRGRHPLRWRRIMLSESLRPQAAQCLRDIVAETACNPALHALLTGLLAQPGRVLAPEGPAKWLRFVVEPCDALGGDLASTPCAVAAVECVLAAALAQHSC